MVNKSRLHVPYVDGISLLFKLYPERRSLSRDGAFDPDPAMMILLNDTFCKA